MRRVAGRQENRKHAVQQSMAGIAHTERLLPVQLDPLLWKVMVSIGFELPVAAAAKCSSFKNI